MLSQQGWFIGSSSRDGYGRTWASLDIRDVQTVAVERWLQSLCCLNGDRLADVTKAKIRNLMSVLFNHAIRYEWLEQGKNPITLVRQSSKRKRIPKILEPHEIRNLLAELKSCFRVMVLIDATTGLRRSELFALKWSDIDFSNSQLNVQRSIYLQVTGDCKTEASCVMVLAFISNEASLVMEPRLHTPYLLAENVVVEPVRRPFRRCCVMPT